MIHQCPCGFATNDQLWFESHQARHLLRRDGQVVRRDHDLSGLTAGELQRANSAACWPPRTGTTPSP